MTHLEPELTNPGGRPPLVSLTIGRLGNGQPSASPQKRRGTLRGGGRGAEGPGNDEIMGTPMGGIAPDNLGGPGHDRHPLFETASPHRPPEERGPGGAGLDEHPGHQRVPHGEGQAERSAPASQIDGRRDAGEQLQAGTGDREMSLNRPRPREASGLRLLEHLEQTSLDHHQRLPAGSIRGPGDDHPTMRFLTF